MNQHQQLDWYQTAETYNVLNDEQTQYLQNLLKGREGEDEFQAWADQYLSFDYQTKRNIWLTTGGPRVEIDHLILTPGYWIAIEVKNYDAHFYYQNGKCQIGRTTIENDIVLRSESAHNVLENITRKLTPRPQIISAMAFINQHCRVHTDYTGPVQIIMRCDIRDFLYDIHLKTVGNPYYLDPQSIDNHLAQFQTSVDFPIPSDQELNWHQAKTGIWCKSCSSQKLDDKGHYLSCLKCNTTEEKRTTVLRYIRNYCILYRKSEFTADEIWHFINCQISKKTIVRTIQENYSLVPNSKTKYYQFL